MSPILNTLIPNTQNGLVASWTNNPYEDIHNAYLLYVDTISNQMSYYYLTQEQAESGEGTIPGELLTTNNLYMVRYVQTQFTPNGAQLGSNTLSATPTYILPPEISPIYEVEDPTNTSVLLTLTFQSGCQLMEQLYFQIFNESLGEFVDPQIFTYPPLPLPSPESEATFELTGLIANNEYVISCVIITESGMTSMASPSITVLTNNFPFPPVIANASSGLDAEIKVGSLTIPNNFIKPIESVTFQTSTNNVNWENNVTIPVSTTETTIELTDSLLTGLLNGTGYYVRAFGTNVEGNGPVSNVLTAVPAQVPVVSTAVLSTDYVSESFTLDFDITQSNFSSGQTYISLYYGNAVLVETQESSDYPGPSSVTFFPEGIEYGQTYYATVYTVENIPAGQQALWVYPTAATTITSLTVQSNDVVPITTPGAVVNLTSTPGDGSLTYNWLAPADAPTYGTSVSYYIALYDQDPNEEPVDPIATQLLGPTTATSVTCPFTGLVNYTPYWASVYASNDSGSGPTSYIGNGSVFPLPPLAAASLTAVQQAVTTTNIPILLTITPPANANAGYLLYDYVIYQSTDNVNFEAVATTYALEVTVYVNLEANVTYYYYVKTSGSLAQNPFTESSINSSPSVSVTTALAPIISNVYFTDYNTTNATIHFTINNNGSPLVGYGPTNAPNNWGIVAFVPPIPPLAGTVYPVWTQFEPNNTPPNNTNNTYSQLLGYPIQDAASQPYLIIAANAIGMSTENAGFYNND